MKKTIFPEPIEKLPEADISLTGAKAYLSQGSGHQVLFMEFEEDVDLPEHCHKGQVGFVLKGEIDLDIGGKKSKYKKGDMYYIPDGIPHSGHIHAGYADITFFDQPDRYGVKNFQ